MINKCDIYRALCCESPPLFAESRPQLSKNSYAKQQLIAFEKAAELYLSQDVPRLGFKEFNEYFINGCRTLYQQPYYERRGRLLVFSVLAYETEKPVYVNALCEILFAIISEHSWCLPAHFLKADDEPLPPGEYACHLDLFSCETGFALAEAIALCRELLPALLVEMVNLEIERRILKPFEREDVFYRFEGMKNNWSAVCGGAIGGAALYLIKSKERLCNILHRCLSCIDVYLSSYGCDGICTEGVDYWNYGFAFYSFFAELLTAKTCGAINLSALPAASKIAKAGSIFYLGGNCTISFSDGSENGAYRVGLCSYLSKNVEGFVMPPPPAAANALDDGCYRYCSALRDLYLKPCGSAGNTAEESDIWLSGAQWKIIKSGQAVLAAKAGHNGESHNHNDCGSFIFVKDNVQLIADLGAGLYDKDYFGEKRYEYLVNRSRSHNVALINQKEQCSGAKHTAREVTAFKNGIKCELSACYSEKELLSYYRTVTMSEGRAELCDELCFAENGAVTEVFCSKAPIALSGGTAVFERAKARAVMHFDATLFSAGIVSESYFNHNGREETAYFLHLTSKENAKVIKFCAVIE